ncbi:hypothetical protein NX801_21195 [Streptomyces sp. LP05-1]|uniref:Uncharacterized protein n=1 Tax=Streptomyces pyxinae TaxID=2970734 RepID=A0ABT2CL31_9ACTN|nr:hypothetical protein [Streptomyces sp. LP05-1]MCS0638124.1 hypothetical protein [Streptomyces sp. LP05-1]
MRRARPGSAPRGTTERALTSVGAGTDFGDAEFAEGDQRGRSGHGRSVELAGPARSAERPGFGGQTGREPQRHVPERPVSKLWHITLSVSGARAPLADVRRALEQLAHDHPFLLTSRYAEDHAEIRYWEEARDLHDAAAVALRLWGEHRQTAQLPPWEIVGLEVIDRETYHLRIAEGYGPPPAAPVGVHPY